MTTLQENQQHKNQTKDEKQNNEIEANTSCFSCSLNSNQQSSILDPEHPRLLIPKLCKQFYRLGWVTGTGGGISIKYG
jgi:hypothetical protein